VILKIEVENEFEKNPAKCYSSMFCFIVVHSVVLQ
jgi:hypothetical protein